MDMEFDVAWSIGEPRFVTTGIVLLTGGRRVVRYLVTSDGEWFILTIPFARVGFS